MNGATTRRSVLAALTALLVCPLFVCLGVGDARSDPPRPPYPVPIPSWVPPLPTGWVPPALPSAFPSAFPATFPSAFPFPGSPAPAAPPPGTPGGAVTPPVAPSWPVPQLPFPGGAPSRVELRRTADVTFGKAGPAARITPLEPHRDHAWYAPSGAAVVTSGGSAGSLQVAGRTVPLAFADGFSATFSPDGARVALVQARAPLAVVSVPDGRVVWQRPEGRECAVRWASPTVMVLHDDTYAARLWRIDVSTGVSTPLGATRHADRCWATPDGSRFIASDGVTVWVVDGATGASTVLVTGAGGVVGSPAGDRVCYSLNNDLFCQSFWPARVEHVMTNVSLASGDMIDEGGHRLLFNSQGTSYLADFATGTVFAVPAARIESGGWIALVGGGHVVATGSYAGTNLYDTDRGAKTLVPGAAGYSVSAAPGRPRSVLQGRETSNGWSDLYVIDLP